MLRLLKLRKEGNNISINAFSEEEYLKANPDIQEAVSRGQFKRGTEHLEKYGLGEIENGQRKFHPDFKAYHEEEYLTHFTDVKALIAGGVFQSAFEHFCQQGYADIISGTKDWPKDEAVREVASAQGTAQDIYGYIERIKGRTIEGWAGSAEKKKAIVSIFVNGLKAVSAIPDIERQDVSSIDTYRYCHGFLVELSMDFIADLFKKSVLEQDRLTIEMQINNQFLNRQFEFSTDTWAAELAKEASGNNFLYYLPLIGYGIERYFSFETLIEALQNLEQYGLDKVLASEKGKLVDALLERQKIDEKDEKELVSYLYIHQDVLFDVANKLYEKQNSRLLAIVNRILNTMNPLDAWQIVQNSAVGQNNIFSTAILEEKLKEERLIAYLSGHPDEIMRQWQQFDWEEKKEKAVSFMSLLLFLQEFDQLASLDITLLEISGMVEKNDITDIVSLQEELFGTNALWEGLLVTVYFMSHGLSKELFITLGENLFGQLGKFDYLNTSVSHWIVSKLIGYDIGGGTLDSMMQKLHELFAEHTLWSDAFVKKINLLHLNRLLQTKDTRFFKMYRFYMKYYLLDREFMLNIHSINSRYIDQDSVLWLRNVENERQKAIQLLAQSAQTDKLISILNTLEYLSREIVKKVKFEIYSNTLNLETKQHIIEHAAYGMFQTGGAYDKLMASSKLDDTVQYEYFESVFVKQTAKEYVESKNNDWYRRALLSRIRPEEERSIFTEELYRYITEETEANNEQIRLMRLLLSELLLLNENGFSERDFSFLHKNYNELADELIRINNNITMHTQLCQYYLNLMHTSVLENETIDYNDFMMENFFFETKDQLREILKIKSGQNITLDAAKKYMRQAMVYPYTLVMVYSCQAYRGTRQKAIRETWYQRTQELGIDCVFVVGGSDTSRMDGDMMYLAVEDTYEKLPQKSIEMFRFACEHFSYERFLKIDDDCFLNVDAYFSDDVLFRADYYGRLTSRPIGGTNRVWHQQKSLSDEAKQAIDLSPEPSDYADGSTGYALSRAACKELIDAYKDIANKQLFISSFLEDKLVGDLLATKNIKVNILNFTSLVYRKINEKKEATFWEYNVLPGQKNRVKVLHCETKDVLQSTWDNYFSQYKHTDQRYFSNTLIKHFFSFGNNEQPFIEEISVRYEKLRHATHIAVIVCKNEFDYLEGLLEHHRNIGIEHFIYIDNGSADDSIEFMQQQSDVSVFISTQLYKNSRFGVNWMEAALTNFCIGKWILVIDADELFVYDDFENKNISVLTDYAEEYGYDSFLAPMIDMYSKNKLSDTDIDSTLPYEVCNYFDEISTMSIQKKEKYGPFSNSVVYSGGLRARVFGRYNKAPTYSYLNQKYCLFKYNPMHKFIEGIHFMGNNRPAPIRAALLHFKYHARFYEKVQEQILGGQHWNGSQEYKRYLSKLETTPDLSLYDENVSVKYENSNSLVEAGYMDRIE